MSAAETKPMMKCGHAANAHRALDAAVNPGAPVCVICIGIAPGAEQVDADYQTAAGRMARCSYFPRGGKQGKCQEPQPSTTALAFFESRPDQPFDRYYCGCWGWD